MRKAKQKKQRPAQRPPRPDPALWVERRAAEAAVEGVRQSWLAEKGRNEFLRKELGETHNAYRNLADLVRITQPMEIKRLIFSGARGMADTVALKVVAAMKAEAKALKRKKARRR